MYGLYAWAFDHGDAVYSQLPHVKVGMSSNEVRALLGPPDTTYVWEEGSPLQVLHYDMGLLAPDDVRVFLDHDTVTQVTYDL
ncbi:hypothetical protein [Hymenobacter frigidus]|uniref:hypothetical protein n=1 Tax=Hymenobacter frigidus TaxID=1524095 RepID=UPI001664B79F|nr:hypothetical protein [Hymenobacter frigidus]